MSVRNSKPVVPMPSSLSLPTPASLQAFIEQTKLANHAFCQSNPGLFENGAEATTGAPLFPSTRTIKQLREQLLAEKEKVAAEKEKWAAEKALFRKQLRPWQFTERMAKGEARFGSYAFSLIDDSLVPYTGKETELKTLQEVKDFYSGKGVNGTPGYGPIKVEAMRTAAPFYWFVSTPKLEERRRSQMKSYTRAKLDSLARDLDVIFHPYDPDYVEVYVLKTDRVFYIYPDGKDWWTYLEGAGMYAPFVQLELEFEGEKVGPESDVKAHVVIEPEHFNGKVKFTAMPVI